MWITVLPRSAFSSLMVFKRVFLLAGSSITGAFVQHQNIYIHCKLACISYLGKLAAGEF